jgi:sensor domain CHASE-containing protein
MFTKTSVATMLEGMNGRLKPLWERWGLLLVGVVVFLAVVFAGSSALKMETARIEAQRKAELVSLGSLLQTRLVRELSDVLSPLVGLNSYLVVRGGNLNGREVNALLERLHGSVRHARNLAIAVGSVITYVHPIIGNEKLIGLDYRSLPAQWPGVRRTIGGGAPILLGPMPLVEEERPDLSGSGTARRKVLGLVST